MIPPWWPLRRTSGLTLVREVHYAMGTLLDVALYHAKPTVGLAILREACQEARRLEDLLSRHLPESELSRLNARAGQGPIGVSPELFQLLVRARWWAKWTHGAFDPTVGAVLALWREVARSGEIPTELRIQAALRQGGWPNLHLRPPRQIELAVAGMSLDLGGIGKGYAADRIGTLLRRREVRHALINFGESSLLAIGPMPNGRPWPILVRGMDDRLGARLIEIEDQAVGTSASWGRTFRLAGKLLSHIVNPRSGRPLERPAAVTVVARMATAAEALSTALLVMVAAGEKIGTLPRGVVAFQAMADGGLVRLGRISGDAGVRHPQL